MWDAQDEHKILSSVVDLTVNPNVLQATASLATLSSNSVSNAALTNTTITPTPSLAIMPNVSATVQLSQSQLSSSLPSSLLQSTTSLLQTSQLLSSTTTNSSTTTLASISSQPTIGNANGSNLSSSLTANELNTRFDVWAECLAELFVYKNILKVPLTRIEAWRMVFFRLNQLFTAVDPV